MKLQVLNKIKLFGWRACHEILPTWVNLAKQRIIGETVCPNYTRFPDTRIHALWDCNVAQDVWVGSLIKPLKCSHGQPDMIKLIEYLLDRLSLVDVELFLVQSWIIWNQRNRVCNAPIAKAIKFYLI